MREPPAVDDVRLAIIAHAGATIGMGRGPHRASRALLDADRAGLDEPLGHLVLDEGADPLLVVLVVCGNADNWETECVLSCRIKVEVIVLVGKRGLLQICSVPAVGILLNKRLPGRPPGGSLAESAHAGRPDRAPVGIDPQIAAANEVEPAVVKVVVGPARQASVLSPP